MVHAPEVTEYMKREASKLDVISDGVDAVNKIKGQKFDDGSKFDTGKDKATFRRYEEACDRVKNFYAEQHAKQTLEYNLRMRDQFKNTVRARMSVWEAMEMLNTLVDESDPDTSVGQIEHLLQTAEAMRRDGKPEWMQVTGLVHDLGKLLCFFGAEGQWDVVGDTFVVGCKFSDKIIYPDTFKANPDYYDEKLQTENGIYEPGCGLDNVLISWGHDEYLADICRKQSTLPKEAISMIRYHSFYPWHREGAYQHLMNEDDKIQLQAVQAFNPYDLYSKSDAPPVVEELKPYYQGLIAKFFPDEIDW
ncbi:myo-inositol oxygenase [Naematelia encephala]|uniref:Inositol oxygenase n=1 Tax=Naematelia encephala TaxID=71784 RepID=A0A1Y2B2V2_9TREE|nr:myo-inositol oxygenase [Naematelia encephala]